MENADTSRSIAFLVFLAGGILAAGVVAPVGTTRLIGLVTLPADVGKTTPNQPGEGIVWHASMQTAQLSTEMVPGVHGEHPAAGETGLKPVARV